MSEILSTDISPGRKLKKRNKSRKNPTGVLHLMLLPTIILLVVYAYIPMFGVLIAFQKFQITKGIAGFFFSPWIGFGNFVRVFNMPGATQAFINTVYIALMKIITMFFVPIIASLLLNEMKKQWYKRSIQTIIYLPHFLSWVILGGVLKNLLSLDGVVNGVVKSLGFSPIFFLGEPHIFPHILIWSNVWQEFGWSTIIFLAAITSIDPALYEAAIMDGANRWRQTWHITLPGMKPIIILCAVLSLGGILNAGFDQVFNLYSVPVYSTGDIIDTLVYRVGLGSGQYEIATAIGLFKSVVSLVFVSASYWLAKRFADYRIF
jgi:putative aldouronate transport system permease protein